MKDIPVESFTLQSFLKSHSVHKNKWFNTEYNCGGESGPCTVLTSAAEDYLAERGIHKMRAPGSDIQNRWPITAMKFLEEMSVDGDSSDDSVYRDAILKVREAMYAIKVNAQNVIDVIDAINKKGAN